MPLPRSSPKKQPFLQQTATQISPINVVSTPKHSLLFINVFFIQYFDNYYKCLYLVLHTTKELECGNFTFLKKAMALREFSRPPAQQERPRVPNRSQETPKLRPEFFSRRKSFPTPDRPKPTDPRLSAGLSDHYESKSGQERNQYLDPRHDQVNRSFSNERMRCLK